MKKLLLGASIIALTLTVSTGLFADDQSSGQLQATQPNNPAQEVQTTTTNATTDSTNQVSDQDMALQPQQTTTDTNQPASTN